MNKSAVSRGSTKTEAKRIHIKAREFLMVFRDRPDDYYLMDRFSLKPRHLRKIYDQLVERGLLTEYEYTLREKKAPEVEMQTSKNLSPASTVVALQTRETCPKCNRAKHPDYPDWCPHCGVVFAKLKNL